MSKEEAPTLAAGALAAGSVRLEGEIGTRAHEHPDSETILAKATMQLNRHAAESSLIKPYCAAAPVCNCITRALVLLAFFPLSVSRVSASSFYGSR